MTNNLSTLISRYPTLFQTLDIAWAHSNLADLNALKPGGYALAKTFNPKSPIPLIYFDFQREILGHPNSHLLQLESAIHNLVAVHNMPVNYHRAELQSVQPGNYLGTAIEFSIAAWLTNALGGICAYNHGQIKSTTSDIVISPIGQPEIYLDIKARILVQVYEEINDYQRHWDQLALTYSSTLGEFSVKWIPDFETLSKIQRKSILDDISQKIEATLKNKLTSNKWDSTLCHPNGCPYIVIEQATYQTRIIGINTNAYLKSTVAKLLDKPHQLSKSNPNIRILVGYHAYSFITGNPYHLKMLTGGNKTKGITGIFQDSDYGNLISGMLYIPIDDLSVGSPIYWIPNTTAAKAVSSGVTSLFQAQTI